MDLFERLKAGAAFEWQAYVGHAFVKEMGKGTLPHRAFQHYLVQDYLFLIQFARAWGLAAYKSRSIDDIARCQETLASILDETKLHIRLCERWGISIRDLNETEERQQTVSYTRFVLDCGAAGDLLDLMVALAPCVVGYAEIGKTLASDITGSIDSHPYRDWIGEYSSESYQLVAQNARYQLDQLAETYLTEARFPKILKIFRQATQLEADFWSMGLDAESL